MSLLLEVSDLRVEFEGGVEAIRGINFTLDRGESVAMVGESGAGKSTLARSLVGLVQPPEAAGSVRLDGNEMIGTSPELLRSLRWSTVAIALQGTPFNPVMTLGAQVAEPLRGAAGLSKEKAHVRAAELAEQVGLDPSMLERFPHEVSGGQRRLATLAMVLALDPALVVLDEPTAGLDPASRRHLVAEVNRLAEERGFALLVISHDLHDAARLAQRMMVLYAGEVIEAGTPDQVLEGAAHPYTWALVNTYPVLSTTKDLRPIRGHAPDPRAVPSGCPYRTRCTQAEDVCTEKHPDLALSRGRLVACHFGGLKTLLAGVDLTRSYGSRRHPVRALDAVSISVQEGESVAIVGPSGSGKSTLAMILAGHLAADSGTVELEGEPLPTSWRGPARARRRRIQLVMQDPAEALSPRLTVEELVAEPLVVAGEGDETHRRDEVRTALHSVGLPSSGDFLAVRAFELSGGQQQRIALARALVARPKLLVADEPTSMLDASEQARMLVVLRERQIEMGLGLVIVSHDLAVVRKVADRIVVLDGGRVVEEGPSHRVATTPESATARRLLDPETVEPRP
ncbi:MAG TPA: ABC transporter ATP-binding protein [Acidimicrobiales bacterium]|nr:ABC transporter ATP-binding protein [Acidimicrobiales bacterium]